MSTSTRSSRPRRRLIRARRGAPAAAPTTPAIASAPALPDLHLEVAPGERVAVVGPTPEERLMLQRALDGRAPDSCGTLRVDGEVWIADDLDDAITRADRIAVLGQGRILHQVHLAATGTRDLSAPSLVALKTRLAAAIA